MSFLNSKDMKKEALIEMIKNYSFPEDAMLLAFSPAKAFFNKYKFDNSVLNSTDQGRIFFIGGELKWHSLNNNYRIVYLGNDQPPIGLDDYSEELVTLVSTQSEYLLWGDSYKDKSNIKQSLENEDQNSLSGLIVIKISQILNNL